MTFQRTRRTFTAEFKLEAAQLVLEQGYSVKDAAVAMGIGHSTMDNWVRQLRKERSGDCPKGSAITPEQRKIQELEAKIRKIERDKEILKKATALLVSDEMNGLR